MMIEYLKRWNKWRKIYDAGPFYKFLVLTGIVYSPSFDITYMNEKIEECILKGISDGLIDGDDTT